MNSSKVKSVIKQGNKHALLVSGVLQREVIQSRLDELDITTIRYVKPLSSTINCEKHLKFRSIALISVVGVIKRGKKKSMRANQYAFLTLMDIYPPRLYSNCFVFSSNTYHTKPLL